MVVFLISLLHIACVILTVHHHVFVNDFIELRNIARQSNCSIVGSLLEAILAHVFLDR